MGACGSTSFDQDEEALLMRRSPAVPLLSPPRQLAQPQHTQTYYPSPIRASVRTPPASPLQQTVRFGSSPLQPFFCLSLFSRYEVIYPTSPTTPDLIFPTAYHLWRSIHFDFTTCMPIVQAIIAQPNISHMREMADKYEYLHKDFPRSLQLETMKKLLVMRFMQHKDCLGALMQSGEAVLEYDDKDRFWGIGLSGEGQNMYGKILMILRRKEGERQRDTKMVRQ